MIQRLIRNVLVSVPMLCALGVSAADPKAEPAKGGGFASSIKEIADEVGEIEKRLVSIDKSVQSVKGIEKSVDELNVSLAQIAAVLKDERLGEMEKSAGDVILVRCAILIVFATACAAGLIVLQARLRNWKPGKGS